MTVEAQWPPFGTRRRVCKKCGETFTLGLNQKTSRRLLCNDCYTPPPAGGSVHPERVAAVAKVRKARRAAGCSAACAQARHRKCHISICKCDCHQPAVVSS